MLITLISLFFSKTNVPLIFHQMGCNLLYYLTILIQENLQWNYNNDKSVQFVQKGSIRQLKNLDFTFHLMKTKSVFLSES